MREPRYWMDEESGILAPVIQKYIFEGELNPEEVAIMRAYLKQWIYADVWSLNKELEGLRREVHSLTKTYEIDMWLLRAEFSGIDPL